MEYITDHIQEMNHYFYSRRSYELSTRLHYLKALKKSILSHQKEIVLALKQDFRKPEYETYMTEIYTTINELNYTIRHLKEWCKPQTVGNTMPLIGSHTKIMREPYGVCLIFAPFNYPFQLAMMPLIGALAAGNCAIIKPSEYTSATNKILKKIISEVFPSYYVCVIEGGIDVCEKLLSEPIDYIFFTGGTETGKKIMRAASEHLIPVTLELGGKSPAIIDANANLKLAAKRLIWGKFLNAWQTCVAPDYVLVHESVAETFLHYVGFALQHFYRNKKDLAHVINEAHYVRLLQLIDEEKIYFGGHFNTDELYIEPTVLYPVQLNDACMQEEIFGPILPIIPYKRLNSAVRIIQRYPKPLACYIFSENKQNIDYLLKQLSFGGGCINDTILHLNHTQAPFGGIGYSGMGAYHGKYSYLTFSHEKSVLYSSYKELPFRYPPYSNKQLKLFRYLIK